MWSATFLEDPNWEKIRNELDRPILESWTGLSEKMKQSIVKRCAQQLIEKESTNGEKTIDPFLRKVKEGEAFLPENGPEDIPSVIPKPNPISESSISIERADPGIPGEIIVDENGKLLKSYLAFTNFTKFLTDSYDQWIVNELSPMIRNTKINVRGGVIRFRNLSLTPPKTAGGEKIYPREARRKGITYGLRIHVDVYIQKYDSEGKRVESEEKLGDKKYLGTIPLMLRSKLCYLNNLTPKQLRAVEEDPSDPFGYFIVSGTEKVVLLQEKLRLNRMLVTSSKKGKEASMTVETPRGTVRINLIVGKYKRINFETRFKAEVKSRGGRGKGRGRGKGKEPEDGGRGGEIKRREQRKAAAAKKNGNYRYIGVEKLFYVLQLREGKTPNPDLMTDQILTFTKEEWRGKVRAEISILKFLFPSEEAPMLVQKDIAQIKGGADVRNVESIVEVVDAIVESELFPQLNIFQDNPYLENIYTLKSNMLAMMVARLVEVNLGLSPPDDRDSWSNKRLESASRAMDQLMKSIWRRYITSIKKEMEEKHIEKHRSDIDRLIDGSNITRFFESSFIGPNWGVPGSVRNNMTQTPNRDSIVALYSHMTRIDVATNRNDKQPSIRMVHGTQYGYICPVETPEGENCGIVKNLAVTTQITYGKPDDNVIREILETSLFSPERTSTHNTCILVNGKFIGWCVGLELRRHLIMFRRTSRPHRDMGITLDSRNYLFVHTDTSRLVRPLLVVEPVEKSNGRVEYEPLIKTKKLMGADIEVLFEEGVIEYVDSFEVESPYFLPAISFDALKEKYDNEKEELALYKESLRDMRRKKRALKKNPESERLIKELKEIQKRLAKIQESLDEIRGRKDFTHVEMDPTSIMGIAASVIPYANHNQGPRNSYQSGMYKQALGITRAHHMACFNGKHKVLAYPTRPLFEPQLNEVLHLNAFPQGEMVWVAFATTTGFTQEDAIVFNRASIDMGKFRMFKYINYRITFKSEGGRVEKLKLPKVSSEEKDAIYEHLEENGLPTIGSRIKERQAIVGKVVMKDTEELANESVLLGYGEEGIVDKVIVTNNGAEMIVFISLRVLRIPIEGDKFAPRNAQKATIGKILPPEDMPITEEGIIPDIIVNPHAIPSRMTHSYLMELIASKAGAIVGERINATSFRQFDKNYFKGILRDYGFNPDGKHVMYSGTTGRKMVARIYSGPCYVQALRHHVQDKIQVRRTGPRSATSRQPVKGRALKGGLRFGEMERDVAIAHGAAYFLKERLCGVSDCYKIVFCKCGQIATKSIIDGEYTCNICRDTASFKPVETTAALKLLNNILAGFGWKQVFQFKIPEEQRERMEKGGHLPIRRKISPGFFSEKELHTLGESEEDD